MTHCRVIAHRGARGYAPENTLAAIDLAARQGADAVEVDVQLTQDDAVVVMHDDTLARTTNVHALYPHRAPWWLSDFTAAEVATLDAGSWYVDEIARPSEARVEFLRTLTDAALDRWVDRDALTRYVSGAGVPTLIDLLDRCHALDLDAHVELKAIPRDPVGLVERVVAIVSSHPHASRVVLSSFDHRTLVRARALDANVRTAALVRDRLADPLAYLASIGAQGLHPGCHGDDDTIGFQSIAGTLDRAGITALTSAGLEVNVWTENDPDRMRRLIDAGVSGIFTDYPDRLRDAVDQPRTS